ncbi:MAG: preprotein translocase subunit YajC [Thermotoga sp. 4484_232]|nr:MAG: preprotein translocase subunit YajC [Thermotoga sp. 4484_232]
MPTILYSGPPGANGSPSGTAPTAGSSWLSMVFLLLVFFLMFYFLIILPQRKKEKDFQRMISALRRGDIVVTVGGIVGKIIDIRKDTVKIKTATATELEITKRAIANVMKEKETKEKAEKTGE